MKRDTRIDALRALAIILIILAHTNPPVLVVQSRIFDVPLMALLLGMSFALSTSKNENKDTYKKYLKKRFTRLIIPAWIFLSIFFIVFFILSYFNSTFGKLLSFKKIITSYTLLSGIGYVWIIRVFFIIALFSPILMYISKNVIRNTHKYLFIILLLSFQYFLCIINYNLSGPKDTLFQAFFSISFGYMIIALIGMWVVKQSKKENFLFALFFLFIFVSLGSIEHFDLLSNQKYPPTVYFISYGLTISLFLLIILSNKKFENILSSKYLNFLSKHSLDIYYWHIFPVTIIDQLNVNINWLLKFIIALVFALLFTVIQKKYFAKFFHPQFRI